MQGISSQTEGPGEAGLKPPRAGHAETPATGPCCHPHVSSLLQESLSFIPETFPPIRPDPPRDPGQFSSVLSHVRLFVTPWTAVLQASLPITNSGSLFKLTSIESVMPPNHLILCRPLLLLPSIFASIRVFSNESAIRIRWPKFRLQHQSLQ